ncbi:hypothetical protein K438DRAFT_1748582 [Mycena galopus ATCC 62051]|nr:hypothetical protein K438DRAFT_1748582 [Mycena galopus ATCC 62051]
MNYGTTRQWSTLKAAARAARLRLVAISEFGFHRLSIWSEFPAAWAEKASKPMERLDRNASLAVHFGHRRNATPAASITGFSDCSAANANRHRIFGPAVCATLTASYAVMRLVSRMCGRRSSSFVQDRDKNEQKTCVGESDHSFKEPGGSVVTERYEEFDGPQRGEPGCKDAYRCNGLNVEIHLGDCNRYARASAVSKRACRNMGRLLEEGESFSQVGAGSRKCAALGCEAQMTEQDTLARLAKRDAASDVNFRNYKLNKLERTETHKAKTAGATSGKPLPSSIWP